MLKVNKKTLIITSIVTILPILIGMFFWDRLPDMMATHFGTDNMANGYSSKAFAVFGIGILMVVLTLCKVLQPGWMIAIFAVIILVPFVYSFWLHVSKSL